MNTVWLLVPGLRRLGYTEDADRILDSCIELVARHGFREYYNPLSGEGLGARRFGWSTLLADMLPGGAGADPQPDEKPYLGSVRDELLAMGGELTNHVRRDLGERVARAGRQIRLGPGR